LIKLTKLHFKVKETANQRNHIHEQYREEKLHNWRKDVESAESMGFDYPHLEYHQEFNFEDCDFDIKKGKFRTPIDSISYYGENEEGDTEIMIYRKYILTIEESVEYLDEIFAQSKNK
jgi:hypothetical protein